MIAALLKIVVGIIVSMAVVLVLALVYNSFYFSSEPLLMTAEHVEPWPFDADTVEVTCCYGRQSVDPSSRQRAELLVQGRTVV